MKYEHESHLCAVTLVTGLFIFFLFVSEFGAFLRMNVRTDMSVDTTRGEKLRINFNISFPRTACGGIRSLF